jgi:hypothetical protein
LPFGFAKRVVATGCAEPIADFAILALRPRCIYGEANMIKAPIQSYRDLEVCQAAMDLAVMVYGVAKRLPSDERYILSSQIRRAGVSIPSNIAEGHSCGEGTVHPSCEDRPRFGWGTVH